MRSRDLLLLLLAPLVATFAFAGCEPTDVWIYSCENFVHGRKGPDGGPEPCPPEGFPEGDAGACPADACFTPLSAWDGPVWLWTGPDEVPLGPDAPTVPACPGGTGHISYEGRADLVAPPACYPCTCEPSVGSCALPSTLTAHSVTCETLDQPHSDVSFDAPATWDGKCDNMNPIGPGMIQSLTVAPLTVEQEWCAVGPPVPAQVVAPYWRTAARACKGLAWSSCEGAKDSTCIPEDDVRIPGSKLCILQGGDHVCPLIPDSPWTERQVFYHSKPQDSRQCTECTCGPPTGSMCTATISVYENSDNTCSGPVVFGQLPISSAEPGPCFDLSPPGKPMGSKSATFPSYTSGTCESIPGTPIGEAKAIDPTTFCCKP
jgi:hypothetical protein